MKGKISIFAVTMLLMSTFASLAFAIGPTQPPVDTTTLYVGTIAWGPRRADPARVYDTASGELLFNVYDTLITYGSSYTNSWGTWPVSEEHYRFVPSLSTNVPDRQEITLTFAETGISTADPTCYWFLVNLTWYHVEGWVDNDANGVVNVGDCLYIGEYTANGMTIEEATTVRTWSIQTTGATWTVVRYFYDFNIRTSPMVTFYDNGLNPVGTLETDDVVYTLQRALANDQAGSPVWMYYKPLFDQMDATAFIADVNVPTHDASWLLAKLIGDAVEDVGGVVRINLGVAFADIAFKQILAQSWGSIMEKDWLLSTPVGGTTTRSNFNSTLYTDVLPADGIPDWVTNVLKHAEPFNPVDVANYAGSGPYLVSVTNQANNLVVLSRNVNYWRGWPAPGRKASLDTINIEYIAAWALGRKEAFIASQLDVCSVPRSNMLEIMNQYGEPAYPNTKTIKNISPTLSMDAYFFCFTINETSSSLYSRKFPDGIPANFFNNTHVRKAFAYAFDRTNFLSEMWMGEAILRETPAVFGLYPDYYNYGPDPPWTYNANITRVIEELKAAMFTQDGVTKSVWNWGGFKVDLFFTGSADPRRIVVQLIKDTFDEINAHNPGKSFQCVLKDPGWFGILEGMDAFELPLWQIGWLADYADAGNWFSPYMHSNGDFCYFQNYSAVNGWDAQVGTRSGVTGKDEIIDLAFITSDGASRQNMYYDLNDIYIREVPNVPTSQPLGRRWCQYWVKGWEFNTLWPSQYYCQQYYYCLYKEDTCWADVTSATPGVPDGRTDMRDIGYVVAHYGAKAPDTSQTPPYDPKWAPGSYGCGGADVYGDRKVDMRDIGFAASHFGHRNVP